MPRGFLCINSAVGRVLLRQAEALGFQKLFKGEWICLFQIFKFIISKMCLLGSRWTLLSTLPLSIAKICEETLSPHPDHGKPSWPRGFPTWGLYCVGSHSLGTSRTQALAPAPGNGLTSKGPGISHSEKAPRDLDAQGGSARPPLPCDTRMPSWVAVSLSDPDTDS